MKKLIPTALIVLAFALVAHSFAKGQTPTPTPIRRITAVPVKSTGPAAQPVNVGRQAATKETPTIEWSPALLSIKDVKQPANEPTIKILVENLGGLPNEAGRGWITVDLMKEVNGKNSPMYFIISGMVKMPSGMKVHVSTGSPFTKTIVLPVIPHGQPVWIDVPFVLPEPGNYLYDHKGDFDLCAAQTAFFASHFQIRVSLVGVKRVPPARYSLETQLSPSYLKFATISPGLYSNCK